MLIIFTMEAQEQIQVLRNTLLLQIGQPCQSHIYTHEKPYQAEQVAGLRGIDGHIYESAIYTKALKSE